MSKHKVRDTAKIVAGDGTRHFARSGGGLGDLSGVDLKTTAPTNGQSLVYNGSNWIPSTPGQPAQVLSRKFISGDLTAETFHNIMVKTKVGYLYVMDFGGTFHASHEDSLGY